MQLHIKRHLILVPFVLLLIAMAGCTASRHALPIALHKEASVNGLQAIRSFGDASMQSYTALIKKWAEQLSKGPYVNKPLTILSLSGGGSDGAFGAGLLCGWTAKGDRPDFTMITGVSTGALIAPFAFLGPDYDHLLRLFYTSFSTDDLVSPRPVGSAIKHSSFFSTQLLQEALKKHISSQTIEAIAQEHRHGRRLLIGTTNLDLMRPVYWDIGQIAQTRTPENDQLIRDVILASASIPVAFPPVYIKVQVRGETYDEMHVDGGVTNQVFTYPVNLNLREVIDQLGIHKTISLYVIRNGLLSPAGKTVEPNIADIAQKSMSSLIRTQGIGDLYRIYHTAQRDDLVFNLAFIPHNFNIKADESELFDTPYMKKLFGIGFSMAKYGQPWHNKPPEIFSPQLPKE